MILYNQKDIELKFQQMEEKTKRKIPKEHHEYLEEKIIPNIDYDPRYGMDPGVQLENYNEYIQILKKICRNDGILIEKEKNKHLENHLLNEEEQLVKDIDINNQTILNAIEISSEKLRKLKHFIQYQKDKIKELEIQKNQEIQDIREENINLMQEKEILESKVFKDLVSKVLTNIPYLPALPSNPNLAQIPRVHSDIEIKRIRRPPTVKTHLNPKENAFRAVVVEVKGALNKGNPLKPIDPQELKEIKEEREKRMKEIKDRKLF